MTHVALDELLRELIAVLDAHGIDYAVIGGLAANAFGLASHGGDLTTELDALLADAPGEAR